MGACGDATTKADAEYEGMLIMAVSDMRPPADRKPEQSEDFNKFRENSRGAWIATNAQAFSSPQYNPTTRAFEFDLAAPHLKRDGTTVNTGFFTAFLPNSLLTNVWGIADPASVTSDSLTTTRRDAGTTTAVSPTVTQAAYGALVNLAS